MLLTAVSSLSAPDSGTTRNGGRDGSRSNTFASTWSFGPKAAIAPCFIARSRSTPAIALGRCAITTTMPPRARMPRNGLRQCRVAFGIKLEFGSSNTTKNGSR